MSYDLNFAVERAIDRLRGIARAERDDQPTLAEWLDQIADSLDAPLQAERRIQERERGAR